MPDTLAQLVRKKYPDAYGNLSDTELEGLVIKKYPGVYDKLPRTSAAPAPAAATPAPAEASLFTRGAHLLTSPVKPVQSALQSLGSMIAGVPKAAPVDNSPANVGEIVKSFLHSIGQGLDTTGLDAAGVNQARQNLMEGLKNPVRALRGAAGEIVGEAGNITPLDLAALRGAAKTSFGNGVTRPGAGAAQVEAARTGPGLKGNYEGPKSDFTRAEDLNTLASQLEQNLGAEKGPGAARPKLDKTKKAAAPGARQTPTVEEAIRSALEEVRKPGGPTDVRKVTLVPSELPPKPATLGTTVDEPPVPGRGVGPLRPMEEPAGMVGFAEQSGSKAVQAQRVRNQLVAARHAELDDLAARVTRVIDKAAAEEERAATARARGEKQAQASTKKLPTGKAEPAAGAGAVPGSTEARAYEKGATPAEAAAARLAERAAMTQAATTKAPGLGKAVRTAPIEERGLAALTGERVRDVFKMEPKEAVSRGLVEKVEVEGKSGYRIVQKMQSAGSGITPAASATLPKMRGGKLVKTSPTTAVNPDAYTAEGIRMPTGKVSTAVSKPVGSELLPITARSEEIAAKIAPPPAEPVPMEVPIEAQKAAVQEVNDRVRARGRTMRLPASTPPAPEPPFPRVSGPAPPLSLNLERLRQAIPGMNAALGTAVIEPPPDAATKLFADTLHAFQAEDVTAGARTGTVTGLRPYPHPTVPIPEGFQLGGGMRNELKRPAGMVSARRLYRKGELAGAPKKELAPQADAPAARSGSLTDLQTSAATGVRPPAGPAAKPNAIRANLEALAARQEARRAEMAAEETKSNLEKAKTGVPQEEWPTMDAVEAELHRTQEEHGYRDPRLVDQMRRWYGSKEAASRLGMDKGLVEQISGPPHKQVPLREVQRQMDARYKHLMDDPSGFIRIEALAATLGAAAGGTIGAQIGGENVEDKAAAAIALAAMGGFAGMMGVRGLEQASRSLKGGKAAALQARQALEAVDTANLLAGPASIKASFGSLGGISAGAWEQLRSGNERGVKAALKYMAKDGPRDWFRTMTGPTDQLRPSSGYTNEVAQRTGLSNRFTDKVLLNVLRPFIAADRVGTKALRMMGYSTPEAERMMLMGEPTTWQGQAVLRTLSSNLTFRLLAKFPRVRIAALERGAEYTPGINKLYKTRGQGPRQGFVQQEGLTSKQLRARAEFGGAAMALGTAYGYYRDPSIAESSFFSSAAGPAALPFGAGIAAGKAMKKGSPGVMEALSSISSSVPQINEQDILQLPNRLVPLRPLRRGLINLGLMEEK